MKFSSFALILASSLNFVCAFERHSVLDAEGKFHLFWTPHPDFIEMEVQVETLGWVGLGFSSNGGMPGADIVTGWINAADGNLTLHDRFADAFATPKIDPTQNYRRLNGYENGTHTVIGFARDWNTCDGEHDFDLVDGGTIRVIWAYHEDDPSDEEPEPGYHGSRNRGAKSLVLRGAAQNTFEPNSPDVKTWQLTRDNYQIPAQDTTYYCEIFKLPKDMIEKKHHMVAMEAVIEPGNERHVHHMILYECFVDGDSESVFEPLIGKGAVCFSEGAPQEFSHCQRHFAFTWASGGWGDVLPGHIGAPGGEPHGGADYFLLETHYDNPDLKPGVLDNSGMRVYYTDRLRPHDSGVFLVGSAVYHLQAIPPKQSAYKSVGRCSSQCTQASIPEQGVNIVYGMLHTHLAGTKVTFRHIRQGVESKPILQDDYYDFDYQISRTLNEEFTLLPGDELITECVYNTRGRSSMTWGGFSTRDEMCMTLARYYPRVAMSNCVSVPTDEVLLGQLGIGSLYDRDQAEGAEEEGKMINFGKIFESRVVKTPSKYGNKSVAEVINGINWSDEEKSRSYEKEMFYGNHYTICEGLPKNDSVRILPVQVLPHPEYEPYMKEDGGKCEKFAKNKSNILGQSWKLLLLFLLL